MDQLSPRYESRHRSWVKFLPDEESFEVENGQTVLSCALAHNIPHNNACGGKGLCSTCRIVIEKGLENCTDPTELETSIAEKLYFPKNLRLACQMSIRERQVVVRRPVIDDLDLQIIRSNEESNKPRPLGKEQQVAAIFTDMKNYTEFVSEMPYYDVAHFLNRYFHQMGNVISNNGGIIIDYYGDGFLSVFESCHHENPSLSAVKAALQMQEELFQFNKYVLLLFNRTIAIRSGIAFGDAVTTWLGASSSEKQVVIGNVVNVASRIEQYNKKLNTSLLASKSVFEKVHDKVIVGTATEAHLKGFGSSMLYEIERLKN